MRLAAAASATAAVSSRLELYPRGMSSLRALKLSLGAVSGLRQLSEADLRGRVTSRYPAARLVPGLVIFRWDAPLFFANAEFFQENLTAAIAAAPSTFKVVLIMVAPSVEWFGTGRMPAVFGSPDLLFSKMTFRSLS